MAISYFDKFRRVKEKASGVYGRDGRDKVINKLLMRGIIRDDDVIRTLLPYGKKDITQLPEDFRHEGILKPKIDTIVGIDLKRNTNYRLLQVNKEALTEYEYEYMRRIKDTLAELLSKNEELQDEQIDQAFQQVVDTMKTKYQSLPEKAMNHLLAAAKRKYKMRWNFMKMAEDFATTGEGVFFVYGHEDKPDFRRVNSAQFASDVAEGFIHEANWQFYREYVSYTELYRRFGKNNIPPELRAKIVNYSNPAPGTTSSYDVPLPENIVGGAFGDPEFNKVGSAGYVLLEHAVWREPRKLLILRHLDKNGNIVRTMVTDDYELNTDSGDIDIEEVWVDDIHEAWVADGKYLVRKGPVYNQVRDVDNIDKAVMPYMGYKIPVDASPVSRGKIYDYLYDVFNYRLMKLVASDKGKKMLMSKAAVPDGMDENEWAASFNEDQLVWADFSDLSIQDINTIAKALDLSLTSDILRYVELKKAVRETLGYVLGVPDGLEGHLSPYMSAQSAQQMVAMSTALLDVFLFGMYESKKDILNAMVEILRMEAARYDKIELQFVMDDMTRTFVKIAGDDLSNATFGLFVQDATSDDEARMMLPGLLQAAVQGRELKMADALEIIRNKDLDAVIETLRNAQLEAERKQAAALQQEAQLKQQEAQNEERKLAQMHQYRLEEIDRKGYWDFKTAIEKSAMLGMSFNPDQDKNKNRINDFYEMMHKEFALLKKELDLQRKDIEQKKKELQTKQ